MKKKFKKLFGICLLFIILFITGCSTNFCNEEDKAGIINNLITLLDEGGEQLPSEYRATPETLDKAGITSLLSKNGQEVPQGEAYTWDYLDQFTVTTDSGTKENVYKTTYVEYIYKQYHPKACLVTGDDDTEKEDSVTKSEIEVKTFGYAAKQGLLELMAWPVSWLFVNGAKLINGGKLSGASVCISIIVITFIIRAIILLCTLKSSKQQQEMQSIQGEMNAINNKYMGKNDPESRNRKAMETMALYKKHNIKPGKALIQPFLTIPIFIAVYSAVKDTNVIFQQSLFGLSLGAKLGTSILSGEILAIIVFILMAGFQFLTMKLPNWLAVKNAKIYDKEKAKGQMNFMTYFFLIMIIVIAWVLPLAMSIYWIASSAFSVIQTFILNAAKSKKKVTRRC